MPALKCMIALDGSSSYCRCSQGGITNNADMLKKVAPVIPSLNAFYLSGCKSHAWWYSTVLTGLYLLLLHHNNDEQKEWVCANIFRYADLPPYAGGFMWLIVALKHKSESGDVEKNISIFGTSVSSLSACAQSSEEVLQEVLLQSGFQL